MNDKIRFIVLVILMSVLFPITLIMIFVGWLIGELGDEYRSFVKFYKRAFEND
jgi:hypothetical protein